jgi:hypothetical protein
VKLQVFENEMLGTYLDVTGMDFVNRTVNLVLSEL